MLKEEKMGKLHIIDHPMIMHKQTLMRDKDTGAKDFRQLLSEISMLMGYEITRDLPMEDVAIETPVARMAAKKISGKKLAIVPILRAGLGMVDGLLSLIPVAKVGHIGLYRDPETHMPVEYYCKMPPDIDNRIVILADPISMLKKRGCTSIKLMCLVGAPEGAKLVMEQHPDVDIYIAAMDERLNEQKYIGPGLGDAGDRLFGTK